MSNSNNNTDDNSNRKEWENSKFAWDNMQGPIFELIEKEDPSFFEEKRRKRLLPFWLLNGILAIFFVAVIIWTLRDFNSNAISLHPTDDRTEHVLMDKNNSLGSAINNNNTISSSNDHPEAERKQQEKSFGVGKVIAKRTSRLASKKLNLGSSSNIASSQIEVPYNEEVSIEKKSSSFISQANASTTDAANLTTANGITTQEEESIFDLEYLALYPIELLDDRPFFISEDRIVDRDLRTGLSHPKYCLNPYAGALVSFSKYKGDSPAANLRNENTSLWYGWQYGLRVDLPLNTKHAIYFDINRAVSFQDIDISTEREVMIEQQNVLLKSTNYIVGAYQELQYGDTLTTGIERNRLLNENKQESIQLNVGFATQCQFNGSLRINPFIGFGIGYMNRHSGFTVSEDGAILAFDSKSPIQKSLLLNLQTGFQLGYSLSDRMSISTRYQYGKQFNDTSVESNLHWRPSFHYVSIGTNFYL